jgi:hypothetical protein
MSIRAVVVAMLVGLALGFAGSGCTSSDPVSIQLTGTKGAPVRGYYVQQGRRVNLDASLPVTMTRPGVTLIAVKKLNAADELRAEAHSKRGGISIGSAAGRPGGVRLELADGFCGGTVEGDESLELPTTAGDQRLVIEPYWHNNTWVFDDPAVGLEKEPFVQGFPR